MPVVDGQGYSGHTPAKQRAFRRFLRKHIRIVRAVIESKKGEAWLRRQYHYFDLNAGCGYSDAIMGSPLIFAEEATRSNGEHVGGGKRFGANLFEKDGKHCKALREHLGKSQRFEIHAGDHANIFPNVAQDYEEGRSNCRPMKRRRAGRKLYGLVYHDPNGMPSFDLLGEVLATPCFSTMDVLIHFSATTLKRVAGVEAFSEDRRLDTYLQAIPKAHWLIADAEPGTANGWQWAFALGTNWDAFSRFGSQGFYPAESPDGKRLIAKFSLTRDEFREHAAEQYDGFQMTLPTKRGA